MTRDGRRRTADPDGVGLLEVLVRIPGRLVSQQRPAARGVGSGYDRETNYLRVYVAGLRKKLEDDPAAPRHLLTEPGMGYRFQPDGSPRRWLTISASGPRRYWSGQGASSNGTPELVGRAQRPGRFAQRGAGEEHDVGLAVGDDLLGLLGVGDQADRAGGDAASRTPAASGTW